MPTPKLTSTLNPWPNLSTSRTLLLTFHQVKLFEFIDKMQIAAAKKIGISSDELGQIYHPIPATTFT